MQRFVPFEDDWDALEQLLAEGLVPYRVGVACDHQAASEVTQQSLQNTDSNHCMH